MAFVWRQTQGDSARRREQGCRARQHHAGNEDGDNELGDCEAHTSGRRHEPGAEWFQVALECGAQGAPFVLCRLAPVLVDGVPDQGQAGDTLGWRRDVDALLVELVTDLLGIDGQGVAEIHGWNDQHGEREQGGQTGGEDSVSLQRSLDALVNGMQRNRDDAPPDDGHDEGLHDVKGPNDEQRDEAGLRDVFDRSGHCPGHWRSLVGCRIGVVHR